MDSMKAQQGDPRDLSEIEDSPENEDFEAMYDKMFENLDEYEEEMID